MAGEWRSGGWLSGRAGRREYWAWVGLLFALGFILSFVPGLGSVTTGLTTMLMLIQIRRLHDFGRTGWWALGATLAPLIVTLGLMSVASLNIGLAAGLATEFALIIWIGAIPGAPGDNRFGPPASFTWLYLLRGR